jgi:hypothetical protein
MARMTTIALPRTVVPRVPDTTGMKRHIRTTATNRMTGETSSTPQIHSANVVDRAHLIFEILEPRSDTTASNLPYQKSHCRIGHHHHHPDNVRQHQHLPSYQTAQRTSKASWLKTMGHISDMARNRRTSVERRTKGRLVSIATGLCQVRRGRLGISIVCEQPIQLITAACTLPGKS